MQRSFEGSAASRALLGLYMTWGASWEFTAGIPTLHKSGMETLLARGIDKECL